jgi:cytoskeletal protein CcmA (bactofilin family)
VSGNIVNNSHLVFLNATAQNYSGNISGSGDVAIENSGTSLTLSGDNTYTGSTIVDALVNITGALRNSEVTVRSGRVYGSGTITNSVRINAYAGVMGNLYFAPGILHTGDVTFYASAQLRPVIVGDTAGSGYDQLQVTGSVSIAASVLLYPGMVQNVSAGDVVTLIKNDGTDAIVGTFSGQNEWSTYNYAGIHFHVTYLYNAEAQTFGDGNDVALVAY